MTKYDTTTPYVASHLIVRKGKRIAFLLRQNTQWMNGYYGLPSGKVEKNETASDAAVREALEEIGITVKRADLKFVHFSYRHDETDWADVFFEINTYKGEPYNAEPKIHGELAWLDPNNLPENTVPFFRHGIEQIETNKLYSEFGWDN